MFKTTLSEAGGFSEEGQSNRYVKMVFKEWGQLKRNSFKTYFINYIALMGVWNFQLQMHGEQLIEGSSKN